jgi:hypothetical protein
MIPNAAKFESKGNLTDKLTEGKIKNPAAALISWTVCYQTMAKQHVMAAIRPAFQ